MISKTRFINLKRCRRYSALEDIHYFKDKTIVKSNLEEEDYKNKILETISSMFDEEGESLIKQDSEHIKVMLPYFNQVEMFAGEAIKEKFGGDVKYSLNTYEQMKFLKEVNEYEFYCYIDGYQEKGNEINLFEVKATTAKKFMDLGYTEKKERISAFYNDRNGILRLKEELDETILENKKYMTQRKKLFDDLSGCGKYVYDLAFQRYVFESKEVENKDIKYYLVVLNPDFIYDGEKYTNDIVKFIDFTKITKEYQIQITKDVDKVINYLEELNFDKVNLSKICQRNSQRQCDFFDICWKDIPKKNSIFNFMSSHNGFKNEEDDRLDRYDLINEGIVHIKDIDKAYLNREANQIQREATDTEIPYINRQKINDAIDCINYPIYHLDFESFPCPIPRFRGEKAYMQSLFQFSIHIEISPGVCHKENDHYEFLSKDDKIDDREELVKQMLDVIDVNSGGTVLVYNQAFEKTRIKELAILYPEYAEDLHKLNDMVFDLMYVIKGNTKLFKELGYSNDEAKLINYYNLDLSGSYSIKKVLPIFSNLSYDNMGVANGTDAMITYAMFNNWLKEDRKKYEIKYRELIDYCKQDTWAMVEILEELRNV